MGTGIPVMWIDSRKFLWKWGTDLPGYPGCGNMMTHHQRLGVPYDLYHIYTIFVQRISLNIHCVTWHFHYWTVDIPHDCPHFFLSTYWIFLVDHSIKIIHFCGLKSLKSPLVSDFWVNQAPDPPESPRVRVGSRSCEVAVRWRKPRWQKDARKVHFQTSRKFTLW